MKLKLNPDVLEKVHPLARERAADFYSGRLSPSQLFVDLDGLMAAGVPFEDCGALVLLYHMREGASLADSVQAAIKNRTSTYLQASKALLSEFANSVEARLIIYRSQAKVLALCETLGVIGRNTKFLESATRDFNRVAGRVLDGDEALHTED